MKDFSAKNSKDLLSRQLAQAGIDIEEEERQASALQMVASGGKYKVQKNTMRLENFGWKEEKANRERDGRIFKIKTFLLLTGTDLGKSWKGFVEENVRAEVLRKKRELQKKNEDELRESMRTQQERADRQRELTYKAKHSNVNNPYSSSISASASGPATGSANESFITIPSVVEELGNNMLATSESAPVLRVTAGGAQHGVKPSAGQLIGIHRNK